MQKIATALYKRRIRGGYIIYARNDNIESNIVYDTITMRLNESQLDKLKQQGISEIDHDKFWKFHYPIYSEEPSMWKSLVIKGKECHAKYHHYLYPIEFYFNSQLQIESGIFSYEVDINPDLIYISLDICVPARSGHTLEHILIVPSLDKTKDKFTIRVCDSENRIYAVLKLIFKKSF